MPPSSTETSQREATLDEYENVKSNLKELLTRKRSLDKNLV